MCPTKSRSFKDTPVVDFAEENRSNLGRGTSLFPHNMNGEIKYLGMFFLEVYRFHQLCMVHVDIFLHDRVNSFELALTFQ